MVVNDSRPVLDHESFFTVHFEVCLNIWIPHFFRLMLMCNTVKAVKKDDALFWHDFRYGHIAEQ